MTLPLQPHASSRFSLGVSEVHVWRASLEDNHHAHTLESFLSSDEIARANRFRFPAHRRRYITARGILRQLLGAYLAIEARQVTFTYSAKGKPNLDVCHTSDLFFNVSHSDDIAALAFTIARHIGVDVEMIRHNVDVDEIPRRFFSSAEQRALAGLNATEKYQGFFNCWTRKEAYIKALGSGLSLPLRDFDVSLVPGEPARLLATRPDPEIAQHWHMACLDFGANCAAAVVVEGRIAQLKISEFVAF
jgi:4'-phosphopantetheinyl transferase